MVQNPFKKLPLSSEVSGWGDDHITEASTSRVTNMIIFSTTSYRIYPIIKDNL